MGDSKEQTKKKTMRFDECLDQVAINHNSESWERVLYLFDMHFNIGVSANYTLETLYSEAVELYADQFKQRISDLEAEIKRKDEALAVLMEKYPKGYNSVYEISEQALKGKS